MKKITIIIGVIILGISVYFFTTSQDTQQAQTQVSSLGAVVAVAEVEVVEDVTFTVSNVQFATLTDENENGIKIGLTIPIRIATSTGFTDETIEMNFGAYNQCRVVKTKTVCLNELNDDIQQNIDAFKENKLRELEELERTSYQDEIIL